MMKTSLAQPVCCLVAVILLQRLLLAFGDNAMFPSDDDKEDEDDADDVDKASSKSLNQSTLPSNGSNITNAAKAFESSTESISTRTTAPASAKIRKLTSATAVPTTKTSSPLAKTLSTRYATTASTAQQRRPKQSQQVEAMIASGLDETDEHMAKYTDAYRTWINEVRDHYDGYIRPNFGGKPVVVQISVFVIGFRSVSEVNMDYTVELYFRQMWEDKRLAFNESGFGRREIYLDAAGRQLLWVPDTNLVNAVFSVDPTLTSMTHMEHTSIRSDGLVFQSKRVSVTAECDMDLRLYPFDQQACRLIMSSYGYATSDIIYKWHRRSPVEMQSTEQLPDFYIHSWKPKMYNSSYLSGTFSTLEFCFVLRRNAGYCIVQLLFPSTVLVAASWISLWVEEEMAFSDVIGVILSILFLSYSYNNVMPKVSYIKGMDFYLGACLLFVFLSLVKMAIVKYMRKKAKKRDEELKAKNSLVGEETSLSYPIDEKSISATPTRKTTIVDSKGRVAILVSRIHNVAAAKIHSAMWHYAKGFHVGSQIILPLGFAAFCIFFFFIYPAMYTARTC